MLVFPLRLRHILTGGGRSYVHRLRRCSELPDARYTIAFASRSSRSFPLFSSSSGALKIRRLCNAKGRNLQLPPQPLIMSQFRGTCRICHNIGLTNLKCLSQMAENPLVSEEQFLSDYYFLSSPESRSSIRIREELQGVFAGRYRIARTADGHGRQE